jgi:hypothetical protein
LAEVGLIAEYPENRRSPRDAEKVPIPHTSRACVTRDLSLSFGGEGNLTQGMALDPCNPATIYLTVCAAGGNRAYPKGVYRSTDAGASWHRILAVDSPNHVRVNPRAPSEIYVSDGVTGGSNGFHRTKDGGATWERITNMCDAVDVAQSCGANDVYDVAVDPADFKHVLISFHSPWNWGDGRGAGVLESKDGGDTWIPHRPFDDWGYGHSVHFLTSHIWLVGTQGNGHYRTTNAGQTWAKVSDANIVHGGSSLYVTGDGVIFSSVSGGIIKSTDNGVSFEMYANNTGSIGIGGDGEHLYFGADTVLSAPLSDPTAWTLSANAPPPRFGGGPFEMAFDERNGIIYSASNQNGLWAMKVLPGR